MRLFYNPDEYPRDQHARRLVRDWEHAKSQEGMDAAAEELEALGLWFFFYLPGQDRDAKMKWLGDPTIGEVVEDFEYVMLDDGLLDLPADQRIGRAAVHVMRR